MGRISRAQMFMEMARSAAKRSTCHRLNVGALVVQDNNPVAVGWNGQLPGAPHCAGNDCPGILPGNCGTLHAEENALLKADQILGKDFYTEPVEVDLYVTHSPCLHCCEYMQGAFVWVKRLFFEVPYRSTQHLRMLTEPSGPLSLRRVTGVYEVTPAGYIVNYFTGEVVELP